MIPGNDQNASPTNKKAARSKLEQMMFYGCWGHLESFSGVSFLAKRLLGCLLRYLVKGLLSNGTVFE